MLKRFEAPLVPLPRTESPDYYIDDTFLLHESFKVLRLISKVFVVDFVLGYSMINEFKLYF